MLQLTSLHSHYCLTGDLSQNLFKNSYSSYLPRKTQPRMRLQLSPLITPCGRRPLLRSPRAHVTPAPLRATAIMADSQPFANELRPWLDQSASANVRDASTRQHFVARDRDGGTIGGDCVVERTIRHRHTGSRIKAEIKRYN